MNSNSTFFERHIKPVFTYIGFIVSIVFGIAYFITVAVMIMGLEAAPTIETFVGFLVANCIAGFCIAVSLIGQGQSFAASIPANKELLQHYYGKKEVKLHSLIYYWIIDIARLVLTRLLGVAAMTYIVIDICWKGNGQYTYMLVALFNLLMFFGFGALGMVKRYDDYNLRYIP